jgi:hypothetical protein
LLEYRLRRRKPERFGVSKDKRESARSRFSTLRKKTKTKKKKKMQTKNLGDCMQTDSEM